MILQEKFDVFNVYKDDKASSFLYADCSNAELFMNGLADYILSESNLLNYANSLTPIEFIPTPRIYKKLYMTLSSFLNEELDLLTYDNVSEEIQTVLGEEYKFISKDGETLLQRDKIGKIGEYTFHVLLSNYFKVHCIIPKFRCTTDRNMSVFGIDALFLNPETSTILFGESKVCKSLENAIQLINRSLSEYESQISEEYRLVLSNDDTFNLSDEFLDIFKEHTDVCMTFEEFVRAANIKRICVPVFMAHGNSKSHNSVEYFLKQMNSKITTKQFFGLDTDYLLISLPIIDKAKMMDSIMKKVVQKANVYGRR